MTHECNPVQAWIPSVEHMPTDSRVCLQSACVMGRKGMLKQTHDEKAVAEKGDSRKSTITEAIVPLDKWEQRARLYHMRVPLTTGH